MWNSGILNGKGSQWADTIFVRLTSKKNPHRKQRGIVGASVLRLERFELQLQVIVIAVILDVTLDNLGRHFITYSVSKVAILPRTRHPTVGA